MASNNLERHFGQWHPMRQSVFGTLARYRPPRVVLAESSSFFAIPITSPRRLSSQDKEFQSATDRAQPRTNLRLWPPLSRSTFKGRSSSIHNRFIIIGEHALASTFLAHLFQSERLD